MDILIPATVMIQKKFNGAALATLEVQVDHQSVEVCQCAAPSIEMATNGVLSMVKGVWKK